MSEDGFLNPVRELVNRGYTRAEEMLKNYHGAWGKDLSHRCLAMPTFFGGIQRDKWSSHRADAPAGVMARTRAMTGVDYFG